ncbi:MAG: glycosyltransferase [Parasporobacterium sp.]|nr:glycosyltransferase [Parasporobacterium sp.]
MERRPIVSIIIPLYNVKEYIEKAFDSICSQTLTNWELFLVDDGSTDGSAEVCDILASDDSRVQVIHQENQGAAAARNAAIGKANGKYLYFMDADDWASPDMLYDMVCLAENYILDAWAGVPVDTAGRHLGAIGRFRQNPADMTADVPEEQCAQLVVTGFYIETYYTESDYFLQKQCVPSRVFGDRREFREYAHELFDRNLLYTPWNKLYLASYIRENQITFPEVHWDDFPFNLQVIKNIDRVTVSEKAYYHFIRKRTDSESEKYNVGLYEKREEENQWLLDLYDEWREDLHGILLEEAKEQGQIPMFIEPEETQTEALEQERNADQSESAAEQTADTSGSEAEETAFLPALNVPAAETLYGPAREFVARRYLERIVGCVENVTNPQCELSRKEKRSEIKQMISQESVREALKAAKPRSLYMKMMLVPIRMKSTSLSYMEGSLISKVKKKNGKLFARLKAGR